MKPYQATTESPRYPGLSPWGWGSGQAWRCSEDAALQEDFRVGWRGGSDILALQCIRMVQENLAAQQQEQFPPVLGAPTRFASKKERSGAATGMLSVPGTRQGGLEAGSTWSAKLSLSFNFPHLLQGPLVGFVQPPTGPRPHRGHGVTTCRSVTSWMGAPFWKCAPTNLSFCNQLDSPSPQHTS
jgi:hypothetical protein